MQNDQSGEHSLEGNVEGQSALPGLQSIPLLPFAVQLQNIFPVEIVARRFPVDIASVIATPTTQLNVGEPIIESEERQAQITVEIQVNFSEEPRPFEISFKLVGVFTYTREYEPEMVRQFLQQGSLSVMLPSARELLLSVCTRLQIPMIVLPLIQLASPSSELD